MATRRYVIVYIINTKELNARFIAVRNHDITKFSPAATWSYNAKSSICTCLTVFSSISISIISIITWQYPKLSTLLIKYPNAAGSFFQTYNDILFSTYNRLISQNSQPITSSTRMEGSRNPRSIILFSRRHKSLSYPNFSAKRNPLHRPLFLNRVIINLMVRTPYHSQSEFNKSINQSGSKMLSRI